MFHMGNDVEHALQVHYAAQSLRLRGVDYAKIARDNFRCDPVGNNADTSDTHESDVSPLFVPSSHVTRTMVYDAGRPLPVSITRGTGSLQRCHAHQATRSFTKSDSRRTRRSVMPHLSPQELVCRRLLYDSSIQH